MNKTTAFLIGLLILSGIIITACTSQNVSPTNTQFPPTSGVPSNDQGVTNRTGAYRGNLSAADRQAMIQQRLQAAIDACTGKNVGDSCILASTRSNITGICKTYNETLECMSNRTFNGSRTGPGVIPTGP